MDARPRSSEHEFQQMLILSRPLLEHVQKKQQLKMPSLRWTQAAVVEPFYSQVFPVAVRFP